MAVPDVSLIVIIAFDDAALVIAANLEYISQGICTGFI